jgi:hypothetical protein
MRSAQQIDDCIPWRKADIDPVPEARPVSGFSAACRVRLLDRKTVLASDSTAFLSRRRGLPASDWRCLPPHGQRHAFVGIQGLRDEQASVVLVAGYDLDQEHDGQIDAMLAQFGQ